MKKTVILLLALLPTAFFLTVCLMPTASAADKTADGYYADVWNKIDGETKKLMESIGITQSAESLSDMTPERVISSAFSLFSDSAADVLPSFCAVLAVMLAVSLLMSFGIKTEGVRQTAECAGCACIMFTVLSVSGGLTEAVTGAVNLTEDFMLGIVPTFTGVIAMSGSPTLALSFNSAVLAFAQGISGTFSSLFPSYASVITSVAAAGVINPYFACEKLTSLLNKLTCGAMTFICGIFTAVLSVKGIIAGAADTVTVKGLRFLIGSSVPVVGSAIGDALNSVIASLGLIRHSVAAVALTAVVLIALPALVKIAVYKISLSLLSVLSDILSLNKISGFIDSVNGIFSLYAAVLCFNAFVFTVSTAIVLTLAK